MATTFAVFVDFDNTGDFATAGDNITSDVREIPLMQIGSYMPYDRVASVGTCTILLDNTSRNYTPLNTGGTHTGKLLPGLPMKIEATSGGTTWVIFRGVTMRWMPNAGLENQTCVLDCADMLYVLQSHTVGLPLQLGFSADELLAMITSQCWNSGFATATVDLLNNPTDGESVSFGTKLGFVTYRFKNTPAQAYDVQIAADSLTTLLNLEAAINLADRDNAYYAGTMRHTQVTANGGALAANARGVWGNSILLQKSPFNSPNIDISDNTFTGGADGPVGMFSYQAGIGVFDVAADIWSPETTNGLTAVTDVVQSEYGMFWAAPDGTLTFKNWGWFFGQSIAAAALTVNGTHTSQSGSMSLDDTYNRIVVSYTPRFTLTSGVIAKSNSIITVPGKSGIERWNKVYDHENSGSIPWLPTTDLRPANPGDAVVRLSYVDQTTGQISGAKNVITPVKTTDFTCWDVSDGTGFNYTNAPPIVYKISAVADGAGIELSFKNTATGPLYFKDMQVRGQAIVSYDDQQIVYESASSVAAYGTRTFDYGIPLSTNREFADGLALWLLSQFSVPKYRVQSISFRNTDAIGAVNLYSLVIGDVVSITEPTTSVTAAAHVIVGITDMISAGGLATERSFTLLSFDQHYFFTLDHATYSTIDSVAVLGM